MQLSERARGVRENEDIRFLFAKVVKRAATNECP